jgi:hypothetical protein
MLPAQTPVELADASRALEPAAVQLRRLARIAAQLGNAGAASVLASAAARLDGMAARDGGVLTAAA